MIDGSDGMNAAAGVIPIEAKQVIDSENTPT